VSVSLYGEMGSYVAEINMNNSTRAGSCSQRINLYPSLSRPVDVPLSKPIKGFVDLDFHNANYADNGKESFRETYELRDKQRNLLEQFVRSTAFQDYIFEATKAIRKKYPVLDGLHKKIRFEADDGLPFENCRGDGVRTSKGNPCKGPTIRKLGR